MFSDLGHLETAQFVVHPQEPASVVFSRPEEFSGTSEAVAARLQDPLLQSASVSFRTAETVTRKLILVCRACILEDYTSRIFGCMPQFRTRIIYSVFAKISSSKCMSILCVRFLIN